MILNVEENHNSTYELNIVINRYYMSCSTTLPIRSLNIGKIGKGRKVVIVMELMNEFPSNGKYFLVAEYTNNILESMKTKIILLGWIIVMDLNGFLFIYYVNFSKSNLHQRDA